MHPPNNPHQDVCLNLSWPDGPVWLVGWELKLPLCAAPATNLQLFIFFMVHTFFILANKYLYSEVTSGSDCFFRCDEYHRAIKTNWRLQRSKKVKHALDKPPISLQVLKQVTHNQRKSCHQLVLSYIDARMQPADGLRKSAGKLSSLDDKLLWKLAAMKCTGRMNIIAQRFLSLQD